MIGYSGSLGELFRMRSIRPSLDLNGSSPLSAQKQREAGIQPGVEAQHLADEIEAVVRVVGEGLGVGPEGDARAVGSVQGLGLPMSYTTRPWLNSMAAGLPSRKAWISKNSLKAFTALMPTPLRPTERLKTSLSYFAPVLICAAHSMSLPSGMPRP
jgi:hypothetical protein